MIQKPRGTIDILPKDVSVWQFIEETSRKVCKRFGFSEIRFPTFEATELFKRGVGDTTDVVQKEMYTFTDREDRSFTLRPEGTASVARSVVENGLSSEPMPLKLYYLINCFRYEKPQAGRSREFYQFGAELFGSENAGADAEMISLAHSIMTGLGIKNIELHINSIGCPECRPKYREALKEYFKAHYSELCDTCKGRLETNPLRILDCKSPVCSEIAKGAPKTVDHLCEACREHMATLESHLGEIGISYTVDPHIVRGLDYYTRTVFEFICNEIGAQATVCGGGRYDGLIKEIGGPSLPGIGFAMGITRLIMAMQACGAGNITPDRPDIYIASLGEKSAVRGAYLASELRKKGFGAECDVMGRSLKAQMKYADKKNSRFTLMLGDSELESGKAQLKNMEDGTQHEVSLSDPTQIIKLISE